MFCHMLIGYARVSTAEQNLDYQVRALHEAGAEKIFQDQISGAGMERPGLTALHTQLQEGDTLLVWKLDRLGRSLVGVVGLLDALRQRGIQIKSLTEPVDTTTPGGMFQFNIITAFAQLERDMIRERVNAGLAESRAKGIRPGRKSKLTDLQWTALEEMVLDPRKTIEQLAANFGVTPRTVYRRLDERGIERPRL